jgi:hypothetical protein
MPILRRSSPRFKRRSEYTLPEYRVEVPRVTRRISLVVARSGPRSGFPEGV